MSFLENIRKPADFAGTTIYNAAQILTVLNQAGFTNGQKSKRWICATARK